MAAKKTTSTGTKKASTTKAASKTGTKTTTKTTGGTKADLQKVREKAVKSVLLHGMDITQAVIAEAEKGSYLGMKALFEFAGIWQPIPEEDLEAAKGARSSLAEILLDAVNNAGDRNVEMSKETSEG